MNILHIEQRWCGTNHNLPAHAVALLAHTDMAATLVTVWMNSTMGISVYASIVVSTTTAIKIEQIGWHAKGMRMRNLVASSVVVATHPLSVTDISAAGRK